MRVDNENRQIQQSKDNIKHWERKEMKMLNRLKDTMSRQDKALNDLNQIQSKSMSPVGIPGHGPRSISTNLNPGLSKIGNTRDAIKK